MDIRFTAQAATEIDCDLLAIAASPAFAQELADLDGRFDGHLLPLLRREGFTGKVGSKVSFPSFGRIAAGQLVVLGIGGGTPADVREAAGHAGHVARSLSAESLALDLGELSTELASSVVENAFAGNYVYDAYKSEEDRKPALQALLLRSRESQDAAIRQGQVRTARQSWARDLVNAPPDELHPQSLAEAARSLGKIAGVTVEVWDIDRCEREGLVGIVAVGRGSARPGCLIHVRYRPKSANAHVALVGKGVTFDSGGLSLKPSGGMQTMRSDMGGAATVLAATAAAAELGLPVAIDCFVGAVENMNDGNSFKLGDILKYTNGVTVEIHNTDAEGRLVLADCLLQASRVEGVTQVVDVATLTGACVVALGGDFTGLFTADDGLAEDLTRSAEANGEGLWRLPLHAPYKKMLRGDWATIKNVGGRDAGATTAALFLEHFVDGPRWAHLDIAGASFTEKNNRFYAPGATGEMVRTLVTWIQGLA